VSLDLRKISLVGDGGLVRIFVTNHGQEYVEQSVAWQAFFSNKENEVLFDLECRMGLREWLTTLRLSQ